MQCELSAENNHHFACNFIKRSLVLKIGYIGHIKNPMAHCTQLPQQRKAVVAKCRTVTDGVSLSVSKSKLVYSSLIFVDDKLTLIYLLT